jgi:hypothetical protein
MEELKPFLDREDSWATRIMSNTRELLRTIGVAVVALVLSVFLFFNLRSTTEEIGRSESHDHYRAGAEWMRANIPAGQIVFNTD